MTNATFIPGSVRVWCQALFRRISKGLKIARRPGLRRPLMRGVAATIELDGVPLPSDLRHVIDVGANRGQFLTWAAARFPDAKFDCFEPFDGSRAKLERVIPAGRVVHVHPMALGATDGESDFIVTADDDSSSLLPPAKTQVENFPGAQSAAVVSVNVRTLDGQLSSVERPALLKLDVQGGELDALKGATHTLDAIDFILAECSFVELYEGQALVGEIVEFLAEKGFDHAGFFSPTASRQGQLLQADALFVRGRPSGNDGARSFGAVGIEGN